MSWSMPFLSHDESLPAACLPVGRAGRGEGKGIWYIHAKQEVFRYGKSMRRSVFLFSLTFLLLSCSDARSVDSEATPEMGQGFRGEVSSVLSVEPETVSSERAAFRTALEQWGRARGGKRELYEKHIDVIGANGILEAIEGLWPKCHSEAHDLGKIIYAQVEDIGLGLQICRDGCYSGCMHGVLMEAFTAAVDPNDPEGHIDPAKLTELMNTTCFKTNAMTDSYSPGDCAHGVGHALMVLWDYEVPEAVRSCAAFASDAMDYYCATGAYMEYVNTRDREDVEKGRSLLYPCDRYNFPAACARYKMVHVVPRLIKSGESVRDLQEMCAVLKGEYRLGCFHGLGNAFLSPLVKGQIGLAHVCSGGDADDQEVCIEGALERMAKYHPERARAVCRAVSGRFRDLCEQARKQEMYNMEKDFQLYVGDHSGD